jgi:hypothetical protein
MNIFRIILLFLLLLEIQASGAAPVVSVSYSHRQTAHLHVNPAIPEGCIIATFFTESAAGVSRTCWPRNCFWVWATWPADPLRWPSTSMVNILVS